MVERNVDSDLCCTVSVPHCFAGRETYLIDNDGRVVHEWRSTRNVFSAYLLPNGNLVRDGSENEIAVCFRAGGAAGFVEEVTWNGDVVWSFGAQPYEAFLTV